MARLWTTLAGLVLWGSTAHAEMPTGFAEFPWGTRADVLTQQFLVRRCGSFTGFSSRAGFSLCHYYRVEGLSILTVRFDFEPDDQLAGYGMSIAPNSYAALRKQVIERFGPPGVRTAFLWFGEQLFWAWDGGEARLIQKCTDETACLEVKTLVLIQKLEQERSRRSPSPF
jgi:hypothetical protein